MPSLNAELEAVARRCVWFRTPEQALARPTEFIAHVLTYGMAADVSALRRHVTDEELVAALDAAPSGVFDGRSWSYWRLMLDLPPRPLPTRQFV